MATTDYSVNSPEAVKLWSRKLSIEAVRDTYFGMTVGRDNNSVTMLKDELSKSEGDRIRCTLRMKPIQPGRQGDATLRGFEEAMVTFTDDLYINQARHAMKSGGRMSEQRVPFAVREELRYALQDWATEYIDESFFAQISNNDPIRYSNNLRAGNNDTVTADASHMIIANGETGETSITDTTAYWFSLAVIDQAKLKARTLSPAVRPIKGEGLWPGVEYMMFITPEQYYDLRRNTAPNEFMEIQKAMLSGDMSLGSRGDKTINMGGTGPQKLCFLYNGVAVYESSFLPRIETLGGESAGGRAVLCGAGAAIASFGRGNGPERFTWVEDLDDYENQFGVAAGTIWGVKGTRYNSQNYGRVIVSTAHSALARNSAGR